MIGKSSRSKRGHDVTAKKQVATFAMAVALATGGLIFGPAGMASADPVKTCSVSTEPVSPGNGQGASMTQTQTETQTSACNSASDQGEVITTGPVTNRGGNAPGGQN
jgi:hypothetical protein